jgi:hypothetical protein
LPPPIAYHSSRLLFIRIFSNQKTNNLLLECSIHIADVTPNFDGLEDT